MKHTLGLRHAVLSGFVALFGLIEPSAVSAQGSALDAGIPLNLALEAAQEAIRTCEASGYRVSVSVVDRSGIEKVLLKGDNSTVHTHETAFKKAYTIATLGPIFATNTTSALTEKVSKTPTGPALSGVTNVILLAGGVGLRAGDEFVGAIGVGGAPGGALDQKCAEAGAAKIDDRLAKR